MKHFVRLLFLALLEFVLVSAQTNPLLQGRTCSTTSGLSSGLPECSAANPCTRNLYGQPSVISQVTAVPVCRSLARFGLNARADAGPKSLNVLGQTRYYCEYIPPGTSTTQKRPLVIWVHGAGTNADSLYDLTNLRVKAETFPLSQTVGVNGFYLVSTQGRNLHWPTEVSRSGPNYDYYYRDFNTPSSNQDIAFFDQLIDTVVATGLVDQVYIMAWSAGGSFSLMYGILRHETPTPGGNRVAAVSVYSSSDPYEDPIPNLTPSCKMATYPTSTVPIQLVSNDCDILPCNEAQKQQIASNGKVAVYPAYPIPDAFGIYIGPGDVIETWINDLRTKVADPNVQWLLVNQNGAPVQQCNPVCTGTLALATHGSWPSGETLSGIASKDLEGTMLQFLKNNPLATQSGTATTTTTTTTSTTPTPSPSTATPTPTIPIPLPSLPPTPMISIPVAIIRA